VERRHPPPLPARILSAADGAKTAARAAAAGGGEGHGVVQEVAAPRRTFLLRARSHGASLRSRVDIQTKEKEEDEGTERVLGCCYLMVHTTI